MNPRLLEHFQMLCDRARESAPERDLDPTLDALGYLLWLAALGEHAQLSPRQTNDLKRLGRRAHLALRSGTPDAKADTEDAEDAAATTHALTELVRASLVVLGAGEIATATPALQATKLHPPTSTLARMLTGRADGLTAGRYALHVMSCARCKQELAALPSGEVVAAPAPVKLAAAAVTRVRAPREGSVIGLKRNPPMEAVLFTDQDVRRLAIYTEGEAPVRVIAQGVTTEEALGGYWIGRVDPALKSVDAKVHLGKRSVAWRIHLSPQKP